MKGHLFERFPKRRARKPGPAFGSCKPKKLQKVFAEIEALFQSFSLEEQAEMVHVGGPRR